MIAPFTIDQLIQSKTASERGIDNTPSDAIKETLKFTAAALERLQFTLGHEVKILSGFRCVALNVAVGGSAKSQHMAGEAVDFVCPGFGSPNNVAAFLSHWMPVLGIDQLILENTWVHVSFSLTPRRQVLTYKDGKYLEGIV